MPVPLCSWGCQCPVGSSSSRAYGELWLTLILMNFNSWESFHLSLWHRVQECRPHIPPCLHERVHLFLLAGPSSCQSPWRQRKMTKFHFHRRLLRGSMHFYFDVLKFVFKTTSAPTLQMLCSLRSLRSKLVAFVHVSISTLLSSLCWDKLGPVVKTNLPVDGQDKDCHQDSNITDDKKYVDTIEGCWFPREKSEHFKNPGEMRWLCVLGPLSLRFQQKVK